MLLMHRGGGGDIVPVGRGRELQPEGEGRRRLDGGSGDPSGSDLLFPGAGSCLVIRLSHFPPHQVQDPQWT